MFDRSLDDASWRHYQNCILVSASGPGCDARCDWDARVRLSAFAFRQNDLVWWSSPFHARKNLNQVVSLHTSLFFGDDSRFNK
jgi:hypothetical protein